MLSASSVLASCHTHTLILSLTVTDRNWFDMSMVAIGWTLLLPAQTGSNTSGIRAIRALRALRPLRTISRFDSLRSVLECFFAVRDMSQSNV